MEKLEHRALWMAIFMVAATVVGTAGGVLFWLAGAHPANAIIAGASGFAGMIVMCLAIAHFLGRVQT
jgi:hypothetical protein